MAGVAAEKAASSRRAKLCFALAEPKFGRTPKEY